MGIVEVMQLLYASKIDLIKARTGLKGSEIQLSKVLRKFVSTTSNIHSNRLSFSFSSSTSQLGIKAQHIKNSAF